MTTTAPTRIPFDYLDKACLSGTSRAHGCSGAPIWEFVIDGQLEPELLRDAFRKTLMAYPTARARVVAEGDPDKAKRFFYEVDERLDTDTLIHIVEIAEGDERALEALRYTVWDHYIDLFTDTPVRLTYARLGPQRGHLFFQQHHAIADGRAFIGLLKRFTEHMRDPELAVTEPTPKIAEDGILGLSRLRRFMWTIAGAFITLATLLGGLLRPIRPMAHNRCNDFTGGNRARFVAIPDRILERWKPAARRAGVNVNAVLTAVMLRTFARWSEGLGQPPGRTNCIVPAETRPRDGSVTSFANHLASFYITADLDPLPTVDALARRIHAQIRKQARRNVHLKKLLAERGVVLGMPMSKMRKLVFNAERASVNVAFSNLIPLEFPTLSGPGWEATAVRICTPGIPWGGAGPTVARYGGELCFNLNYTESAVPTHSMDQLVAIFRDELDAAWQGLGCDPLPAP